MTPDSCPLPPAQQTRNLLIFAACKGLIYLAAPVLYITVQAALCDRLGASIFVSNIPKGAYMATTVAPVLVAWYWPFVRVLKRNLVVCFLAASASLLAVSGILVAPVPAPVQIAVIILQTVVCGACLPTADALIWEMMGRGVAESRRGLTLALAFGLGPVLAAASSLASGALLKDEVRERWLPGLTPPLNYVVLFGVSAPMMALAAILCSRCVVPPPDRELVRDTFARGVFGGIVAFLTDRVLLTATFVIVLVYTTNTIDSNMNLYSRDVLGNAPDQYVSLQNFFRFGTKAIAGVLLGWLLTRTHPKAGLLATSILFLASVVWAMVVTGPWYQVAFCLYGAGELVGVYAPNYVLAASRKADFRRNMAMANLMMFPAAPAAYLFGAIADYFEVRGDPVLGYRLSFIACAAFILAGIFIAIVFLPARPRPKEEETSL